MSLENFFLTILIFVSAILYSSVGHAGASGYLAAMALFGVESAVMKPTALCLNILVAMITTIRFYYAKCFSWNIFWPFAISSIPCAFIGGWISVPSSNYKQIVGGVLFFSSYKLIMQTTTKNKNYSLQPLSLLGAIIAGAIIGLLSGLTGVGGGIFLSPFLLLMKWADVRQTSGISAAFILVNSISGLFGHLSVVRQVPSLIGLLAVAAIVGGIIGSELGSRHLGNVGLRRVLAFVLTIAGFKMILI